MEACSSKSLWCGVSVWFDLQLGQHKESIRSSQNEEQNAPGIDRSKLSEMKISEIRCQPQENAGQLVEDQRTNQQNSTRWNEANCTWTYNLPRIPNKESQSIGHNLIFISQRKTCPFYNTFSQFRRPLLCASYLLGKIAFQRMLHWTILIQTKKRT